MRIGDNGAVFYFAPTTAQRGIIISSFFLLLCGCLGRTLIRERVKPLICFSRLSSKGTSPSSDYVTVAVFFKIRHTLQVILAKDLARCGRPLVCTLDGIKTMSLDSSAPAKSVFLGSIIFFDSCSFRCFRFFS